MKNNFHPVPPQSITDNTFNLIGKDWMLITAGAPDNFNTMTASWGGLGVLWNKNIVWCVIRPQRYTYQFMEREKDFTLSFFTEEFREALNLCGTKSGRDLDKARAAGITPVQGAHPGTTTFEEARLYISCRKIYWDDINPGHFLAPEIQKNYTANDYHRIYIGEISGCYVK
ncbi:MAG: flavin reductase family protein [Armatimonadota bacterium]